MSSPTPESPLPPISIQLSALSGYLSAFRPHCPCQVRFAERVTSIRSRRSSLAEFASTQPVKKWVTGLMVHVAKDS